MNLHHNIKAIREQRGMTQRDLARKAGDYLIAQGLSSAYMDRGIISKIERGARRVTAMELKALAVAMGCTTDELFSD